MAMVMVVVVVDAIISLEGKSSADKQSDFTVSPARLHLNPSHRVRKRV